jgi:hypothetical protein
MLDVKQTLNMHAIAYPYTTWSDVIIPVGNQDKTLMTYVTLCPETATRTKMFVGFSQNIGIPNWILVSMGKAIVEQDRAILENLDSKYLSSGIDGDHDDLIAEYRTTLAKLIFK